MSKRITGVSTLFVTSLLIHSGNAFCAGESGLYLGASGGLANADASSKVIDEAVLDLGFQDSSTDIDDEDGAWKIFGGYRINRYFAVEAAYVNLGETRVTTKTTSPTAKVDGKAEADGISLQGIVRVPITEIFGLFAKAGAYRWRVDSDYKLIQDGVVIDRNSDDAKGTNLNYGAGVSVEWGNGLAFRAEWEHFNNVGDDRKTGESDVDLYSFGIRYLF